MAAGRPARRAELLRSGADIVVISRDNLKDAVEPDVPGRFNTLILDELSGFKSRGSLRWKLASKVIRQMPIQPHVWGLTGTPSPNGLMDLWAQVYLLDGGQRLGKTLGGFRSRYFTATDRLPSGVVIDWALNPGADDRIHRLLEDICLSMSTDGRIDLPPVTVNLVEVPLPPKVRAMYKDMKQDLVAGMDLIGGREVFSAANAAVLSNRLSQMSAGFLYPDADADASGTPGGYTVLHREKLTALREIVEGTGSPVLVFYRYRAEAELIREEFGAVCRTIDEPGVLQAWDRGEVRMLLAHPASAGHGLNLQMGGHTIVWTTLPWSLEEYQQANKRLARQGQQNPVVIHVLTAPKTVDASILAALENKKSVQQALLDHLESPL